MNDQPPDEQRPDDGPAGDERLDELTWVSEALAAPVDVDAETREAHIAAAMAVFDERVGAHPATVPVVSIEAARRRRRARWVAAAAAVVVVVAGVGAGLVASQDDTSSTSRADRTVEASTEADSSLSEGSSSSSSADQLTAPPESSAGEAAPGTATDFGSRNSATDAAGVAASYPDVESLRRAVVALSPTATLPAPRCPPVLATGERVVGGLSSTVQGQPVEAWLLEDTSGARRVVVLEVPTCASR